MEENKENEVDLVDLFFYLKKKIALILIVTLGFGAVGFIGTKLFGTPVYQATTTLYVQSRASQNTISYTDIQIATQLAKDSTPIIKSRRVTSNVIRELGLNITDEKLRARIDVSAETNTRVLTVSVTDTEPQRAADTANCVGKYAAQAVVDIMDVNAVKTVDPAVKPDRPVGPSATKNGAILAIAAFVVTVGILCATRMLGRTLHTEEDVERRLGLSVLASIPAVDGLDAAKKTARPRLPVPARGARQQKRK